MSTYPIGQSDATIKVARSRGPLARFPALETLGVPAFRALWAGHSLVQLGHHTRLMLFAWLTLEITDSQVWVGLVNGLPAIGMAFFAVWGGLLADRSSPRVTLMRSRITMVAGALAAAFLATAGMLQVWQLLLLSLVIGGITGMDFVAYRVMMASAVGKLRVLNASTLSGISTNLANILGPAIGGILLAKVGSSAALWTVSLALIFALLVISRLPKEEISKKTLSSPLGDLVAGMKYSWHTPHARWLIILGAAAVLAAGFFPLVPVHVRDVLQLGPEGLGLLMGAFGAGGLVGSLVLITVRDISRKGLALVLLSLVWCLGVLGLAISHDFYFSFGCLFLIGVALSMWLNSLQTLLLTTVDSSMQGRVFSLNKVMMQLPMAWLLGGMLAEVFGYFGTLTLGGGVFVLLHLVAYWRTPELRK